MKSILLECENTIKGKNDFLSSKLLEKFHFHKYFIDSCKKQKEEKNPFNAFRNKYNCHNSELNCLNLNMKAF